MTFGLNLEMIINKFILSEKEKVMRMQVFFLYYIIFPYYGIIFL
jgi:hypothetical protein